MVPEVTMANDRRISRVGRELGLRRSWIGAAGVAIFYRWAGLLHRDGENGLYRV